MIDETTILIRSDELIEVETVTEEELLRQLIEFTPQFEQHWGSDHNLFREDDGSFTLQGVCAEFSHFFRETYLSWSESTLVELFDFVESNVAGDGTAETLLDNALCTCFLENIACLPAGAAVRRFMGRDSRWFFDQWHERSD